jgi:hypothetical protein
LLSALLVFIERFDPYLVLTLGALACISLAVANVVLAFGAVETLRWETLRCYDDTTSDGEYEVNLDKGQPGQARLIKVPPQMR